jgi:hypothetical protein
MAVRSFKLSVHVGPASVFYGAEYDPPVRGCGGSFGVIYRGGSLHGLGYDALCELGNGQHAVALDQDVGTIVGERPTMSADDDLIDIVSFELFMERAGCGMSGGPLCTILRSFNERTATAIDRLLEPRHREELVEWCNSIPRFRWQRKRRKFQIFYSSGGFVDIPDENLVALRRYYRSR